MIATAAPPGAFDPSTAVSPVVFVTQVPTRRDRETAKLIPSVNIGPAAEFGTLHIIFPAAAAFYASAELVRQMRTTLRAYNFARGDSLLALGDPAILAVAGSVLALTTRQYRVLKWDRRTSRYISVEISL